MSRYRALTLTLLIALTSLAFTSTAVADPKTGAAQKSHIDLVIALDTSGSMDGLIDSARQKLWDIVNDLATAKPSPELRVGLISFGNDGYSDEGWTRIDVGLTTDLDTVHEKLMALRTNGGTEYVGRAINVAHNGMKWSKTKGALKMVFVAGNESVDQDGSFRVMSESGKAIANDIVINTIYCGAEQAGDATGWRNVALRADGQFASIDQNRDTVAITTPMDKRLGELSNKLNSTYIAYGSRGGAGMERQMRADSSAFGLSSASGASRAKAKASTLYKNAEWDLVDGLEDKKVALEAIPAAELPKEMKGMNKDERSAFVKKKKADRERIKKQIAELSKKRDAYIKAEKKKLGKAAQSGFDKAVRDTIRKQAKKKGIVIP